MARATYQLLLPRRIDHVDRVPGYEFTVAEQFGDTLVNEGVAVRVASAPVAALLQPRPASAPPRLQPLPRFTRRCCGWN